MAADFFDASLRHWEDAELLFQSARWANADQLYGFSAECGLKRIMLAFGMPLDAHGTAPQLPQDRKHVDQLWDRYGAYVSGNTAQHYVIPSVNPFAAWNASQRYANRNAIDRGMTEAHRIATEEIQELLGRARREGRIL